MIQAFQDALSLRCLLRQKQSSKKKNPRLTELIKQMVQKVEESAVRHIPQEGPQEESWNSDADILIYGGAAGGGKTYFLLLHPLRYIDNPQFGAVIFRRTNPQIKNEGGIWDESEQIYPAYGGESNLTSMLWRFPSGATISCRQFQHEKDINNWRGAQIACILIDQLEQFTEKQFWGLVERNRSMCGVRPHIRASCNPRIGWLGEFIAWWINQETGYPIPERSGVKRWFVRVDEEILWADTPEELKEKYPDIPPLSVAFIPSKVTDNKILLETNPNYLGILMALPRVERLRQLGGNWLINEADGIFETSRIAIINYHPAQVARVRYWDKAGTQAGGDYSCGVLMAKDSDGFYYVEDVIRGQWSALERNRLMKQAAQMDRDRFGYHEIWVEQEPGSGGKESAEISVRELAGFDVHIEKVTGEKLFRMNPFAAQVEAGNVKLVKAEWNRAYLDELRAIPGSTYMDQGDASSGAFNKLAMKSVNVRIYAPEGNSVMDKHNPSDW